MRKINLLLVRCVLTSVLILLVSTNVTGQIIPFNDYPSFQSVRSGDFSNPATWSISFDGGRTWQQSFVVPDTAYSLSVCSNHEIYQDKDYRVFGNLDINSDEHGENGGKWFILPGVKLTVDGFPGSQARLRITQSINDFNEWIPGSGKVVGSPTSSLIKGANAEINDLPMDQEVENGNQLQNLEIVNGLVTLSSPLKIKGILKLDGGVLTTRNFLTLATTASVQEITNSGNVIGLVTTERFFPSDGKWRPINTPLRNDAAAPSINAAWQEGLINTVNTNPPQYPGTPGYGTQLFNGTKPGYDKANANTSANFYCWGGKNWASVPSTLATKVTAQPAFAIRVNGDRSTPSNQLSPYGTTLRATGNLNTGTIVNTYTVTNHSLVVIPNPYPHAIDIVKVLNRSTGLKKTRFWIWDPLLSHDGGYLKWENGVLTPDSSPSYANALAGKTLPSGGAFFAEAIATAVTVIFLESDKTTSATPVAARTVINLSAGNIPLIEGESLQSITERTFKDLFDEKQTSKELKVYPNPFHDQITVGGLEKPTEFNLYNMLGSKVLTVTTTGSIDCSKLPRGTYVLKGVGITKTVVKAE